MENSIARRIFDFLKEQLPYSLIDEEVLMRISERVVVQYRPAGEIIFRAGEHPGEHIFVIREGAVHLLKEDEGREAMVEQCGEGETFGIRPLLADDDYALTARTAEDTLLYAINTVGFRELLDANPQLTHYLATSMASDIRRKLDTNLRGRLRLVEATTDANAPLIEIQSIDWSKPPVVCSPDEPIREAAQLMSDENVGSIIVVNAEQFPVGIVTDRDLRRHVVTGLYSLKSPIKDIMTSPVVTIPPDVTVADVQIVMVKFDIHHLVVTEDGSRNSPVKGIISEHDLLVRQGNNPATLVREIHRTTMVEGLRTLRVRAEDILRQYLEREVSISYTSTIMTRINDELLIRCIQLAERELKIAGRGRPPVPYSWLALGSQGRGEQLLRTDQDSALIFADVPAEEEEAVRDYFLALAQRVTEKLFGIGYDYCPGDMMASNARWCMSVSDWKEQFSKWIRTPDNDAMLHISIFMDYRPVHGATELADELTEHIFGQVGDQSVFLSLLASAALQNPPPLTFFRNLVVESSGEHKDEFDIKSRAMRPLTDAARVLILHAKVGKINNTFRRFAKLAELEPKHTDLYRDAADAYEILMRLRALQGLRREDSGRYFATKDLTRIQQILLRNSFKPIKELQTLLNVRFQLAYLR